MGDVPVSMLRPGLELAWAVARAGVGAVPPVPAPPALRPLLGFARLPDRALAAVRRSLDSDEGFRQRVAEVATEDIVGRAAWLWLARPDGWSEELADLARKEEENEEAEAGEKAERRAAKRLVGAEEALARSEIQVAQLEQLVEAERRELQEARQARQRAEAEAGSLRAAVLAARQEAEAAKADLRAAEAEAREARAAMGAAQEALGAAAEVRAHLTEERDGLRREVERQAREITTLTIALDRALEAADGSGRAAESASRTSPDAVGEGIAEAAAAAQQLGAALARAAAAWAKGPPSPTVRVHRPEVGGRPRPSHRSARRREVRLPLAVFEDSTEAAAHLVRITGMVLLVDGYNVSLQAWPGADIAAQRDRLTSALAELAMRVPASVQVIFDGDENLQFPSPPGVARSPLRVSFSPAGVDADEVIIDLVDAIPASQPVTVATDDRRVQEEVRRRGANVISVSQLLGVLGRGNRLTHRR